VIGSLAIFIAFAVGSNGQQVPSGKSPPSLGSLRAALGDNEALVTSVSGDHVWQYHRALSGIDAGDSEILFPAGLADQRYYLNATYVYHNVGLTTEQYYLAFETVHNGVVKLEWNVALDKIDVDNKDWPQVFDRIGTIERMLARRGLYVREPVPANAIKKLSAVQGLAAYLYNPSFGNDFIDYWYVGEDGAEGKKRTQQLALVTFGVPIVPHYPPFSFPFPISPEEEALTQVPSKKAGA